MIDKPTGPASRTVRFLAITPTVAGVILWAMRELEALPRIVLHYLLLDARGLFNGHEFWFNGRWIVPGWRWLAPSYEYIAGSWEASFAVGLALFVGGVVALGINKLVIRLHRNPSQ